MLRHARRILVAWLALMLGVLPLIPARWTTVALAGPSAQAYVEQAIPLANRGQCARAVELLRRAVAIDSRYVRAYTWLGFCYAKMGRNKDAIAAFNRVIALSPPNSDDARFARAWIGRIQPSPAKRPTPRSTLAGPTPPALVYLVTLPAAVGITEANRPREVQLFGVTYRRALVERRNWWQRRRPAELEWRVIYNLQRRFSRFRAVAGVEDGTPLEFTATFEIRADGNTVFAGKPKRAGDVPDTVEIDISGVLQLELVVIGRDPLHTRDLSVVWADPFVDPRPGPTQPSPIPTPMAPQVTPTVAPPASPAPSPVPPSPTPGSWRPQTPRVRLI